MCAGAHAQPFLLRCPAETSPVKAGSPLADRCHSLPFLFPPLAAVGSLPPYAGFFVSFLAGARKEGPRQGKHFALQNDKQVMTCPYSRRSIKFC